MLKIKYFTLIIGILSLSVGIAAKKKKVDQILIIQNQISTAYKLDYVDAAPLEMAGVEKKVITARKLRDKRKNKEFVKLIAQIKADLKIVKKRFEINQLYEKLIILQQQNLQSKKILNELKGQL